MPIMEKIELMLPVGSWESLVAAHQGGADSIYFGVEGLNMRSASSVNFSIEDMGRIVDFCHANGMRSYLTLNTVLYDGDLEYMLLVLDAAAKAAVSAVIVSDQAAIAAARERGLSIHLSTQLNISNIESVKFYAQWADVMVLARELELPAVRKIANAIRDQHIVGPSGEAIRIEMFAHGALCMAVSGKCYLSLHEANRSANRGECRQICRRQYAVRDVETGNELMIDNKYIMSPKDLCTIDFLDSMIDAGVRVLKIEGRARGGEYVRTVGESYRIAIDAIGAGRWSKELAGELKSNLLKVFNRGFWGGYYLGHRLGEWSASYGSSARERKVYVGRVTNFFTRHSVAELLLESSDLSTGDKLVALGSTTGAEFFVCPSVYFNEEPCVVALKGSAVSIKTECSLRRGDKIYKLVSVDDL
ncbi:MAG: peptidase U32 family protein [Mucinivorans sp.]